MLEWFKKQHWLRNFYVLTSFAFVIWMLVFDSNNWRMMARTYYNLQVAQSEKRYYQQQKQAVIKERDEVMGNPALLEKYAREHYLMKKPTEDLYLLEEVKEK